MRLSDTVIGAAFAAGGAAVGLATLDFPSLDDGSPGPALFPRILAVLLVLFGLRLAYQGVRARRPPPVGPAPGAPGLGRRGWVNAALVFAGIVAFMLLAPSLGFLLTSAVILLGLMWRLGTPVLRAALASAGITLFVYLIFGKLLRVPLPLGLLWF